ncbi:MULTISPECIES: nucleotidyltransferase family protein [unclassified Anaeromyxobacter]|uniref:nucleotidyltransferase family protein n=1 Tax=unclassified Anaeromyxobacter TaxID=2620896 RepID=UPI001F5AB4D9|nr:MULTISPECIES: nucleotidyltransferase family protein [unclassified Anaeromyxobacter]
MAAVALLDALRALTDFTPPRALPDADLSLLGDVLEAHGLGPLASYQLETTRLGAGLPEAFRERLLGNYQGVVNDNVLKLVSLRNALREAPELPVVLLDAAAYVDWLYPHMAFRPVGEVRIAMRPADREQLVSRVPALHVERTEHEGRTAVLADERITIAVQDALWPGGPAEGPLFERGRPHRAFGPGAARPSAEDALLGTVAEQAGLGLFAPLITYVDVRELLRLELDLRYLHARAADLRLSRALFGSSLLAAHFYPEIADAAARVRPALGIAERLAVERVVEAAKDPAQLRHLRGVDAAARLVVAP